MLLNEKENRVQSAKKLQAQQSQELANLYQIVNQTVNHKILHQFYPNLIRPGIRLI